MTFARTALEFNLSFSLSLEDDGEIPHAIRESRRDTSPVNCRAVRRKMGRDFWSVACDLAKKIAVPPARRWTWPIRPECWRSSRYAAAPASRVSGVFSPWKCEFNLRWPTFRYFAIVGDIQRLLCFSEREISTATVGCSASFAGGDVPSAKAPVVDASRGKAEV